MGDRLQVRAVPLSPEAWAPFGWLPVPDTDPADGDGRLAFAWDDAHVNVISHAPGEVVRHDGALVCSAMFRHDTHTQVLLVLDVPAVMAVAPADVALTAAADVDAIRAFRLEPLQAVVLHRGTWHWGPHPIGDRPVHLFNVQGRRYAEDNTMADLESTVGRVEVVLS